MTTTDTNPAHTNPAHVLRRTIARVHPWLLRLAVLAIVADIVLELAGHDGIPFRVLLPLLLAVVALGLVSPPPSGLDPVRMAPPVRGRWVVANGPGSQVPSHGTRGTGQKYAVDILRPTTPDTPRLPRWGFLPSRPEEFPSFGEPVVAMAGGEVLRVVDGRRDHRARDTWPALIYMMTVEGFGRSVAGWPAIAGNHVVIRHDDGLTSLYAHLRRGTTRVRPGQRVTAGDQLGAVGNTGNSSDPHLHVQLMEHSSIRISSGVPMLWDGIEWDDDVDPRWSAHVTPPEDSAIAGFPPNGTAFDTDGFETDVFETGGFETGA